MKYYYHDIFPIPLPDGHRFPEDKYRLLRLRLLADGIVMPDELFISEPASIEQVLLIHEKAYLEHIIAGTLSTAELRRLGLPWSTQLVQRALHSVGSTIQACRAAFEEGIGINLGGGTHHAHAGHGAGYCVFNDVAIAARLMQQEGRASHVIILDCDVHQGDGTAAIFAGDTSVFTFSIHGEKNFPFHKVDSDLDIPLPDGTSDQKYLQALQEGLNQVFTSKETELAFYLAGADPYQGDRLGRLALSKAGLAERDQLVLEACKKSGVPICLVLAGGYARQIEDIVDIHTATVRIAKKTFEG
jgi:acetoin utilization deacetylase AcuC-like enzyme